MTDDEMEAMLKQLSDKVFASIPTTVYSSTSEREEALEAELAEARAELARLSAAVSPEALDLVPAFRMMQAIAEERAAIVAYLRYQAEVFVDDERALCRAADNIERGEHRREEK